jgi:hypothetical protein
VESETALVGAQSRVELHAVSSVDLALALVVLPGDTELDDALGDGGNLESLDRGQSLSRHYYFGVKSRSFAEGRCQACSVSLVG